MKRILLVCLGNICRSPTAHGVLLGKIEDAGLSGSVEVQSAGTGMWHVGEAPDVRAIEAAKTRGYDLSGLRAQQVQDGDFSRFDLILAMDYSNYDELMIRCPEESKSKINLFLPFSGVSEVDEVPDPYYGGAKGFDKVLDLVEQAADNLVARFTERTL
ncbi:low molecular weight protein-tyrosine-phosphatase [Parendozoicomonas sp. Alg238-R29]|uniref:low molecular weight protein-tyrosine-phosphatase n=1 Tax=Parendozoicomonas sp. Alg238-R29 TaxID=2993446 RepID=UPI00248F38B6|nr:low molecular weight protein-tyrosine-phosphatase [Parendozoicomonas sp. Alg238-R29]